MQEHHVPSLLSYNFCSYSYSYFIKLTREMHSLPLYEGCLFAKGKSISYAHSDVALVCTQETTESQPPVHRFLVEAHLLLFITWETRSRLPKKPARPPMKHSVLFLVYVQSCSDPACSILGAESPFLCFDSLQLHFTCSMSPD